MSHATRVQARRANKEHQAAVWKGESHATALFSYIFLAVIMFSFAGWMFSLGGIGVPVGIATVVALLIVMGRKAAARAGV